MCGDKRINWNQGVVYTLEMTSACRRRCTTVAGLKTEITPLTDLVFLTNAPNVVDSIVSVLSVSGGIGLQLTGKRHGITGLIFRRPIGPIGAPYVDGSDVLSCRAGEKRGWVWMAVWP